MAIVPSDMSMHGMSWCNESECAHALSGQFDLISPSSLYSKLVCKRLGCIARGAGQDREAHASEQLGRAFGGILIHYLQQSGLLLDTEDQKLPARGSVQHRNIFASQILPSSL